MQLTKLLLITMAVIISACTTVPHEPTIQIKTIEVKVPVPVACKTPTPRPPVYCFKDLKESDNIFVKAKCLLSDRKKSIAYDIELLAALNSCK